jgi:hypothetical protein
MCKIGMICSAKPILTKDLVCTAKGRIFNDMAIFAIRTLDERPCLYIRDKPIFSSERMLHKDYDRKDSVEKKSLVTSLKKLDAKTK